MPKKLTNHSRPRALAVLVHLDRGTGQSKTFYRETNQMIICLMMIATIVVMMERRMATAVMLLILGRMVMIPMHDYDDGL